MEVVEGRMSGLVVVTSRWEEVERIVCNVAVHARVTLVAGEDSSLWLVVTRAEVGMLRIRQSRHV